MPDFYIKRPADDNLYERLLDGDYCHVLSPPQTGKTFLLQKVKSRLEADGVKCAVIYLKTNLDHNPIRKETAQECHWGFIEDLVQQFTLTNGQSLAAQPSYRDFRHRLDVSVDNILLQNFIETILLQEIQDNIVIFIDEIEGLIDQNLFPHEFPSNFLSALLYCYKKRKNWHNRNKFKRISFALFGEPCAANLSIIYQCKLLFDPGQKIDLDDFQLSNFQEKELQTLIEQKLGVNDISEKFEDWEIVIKTILDWTNGQPLLTNEILQILLKPNCPFLTRGKEQNHIRNMVQPRILGRVTVVPHFATIDQYLVANPKFLQLYQQTFQTDGLIWDDSPEQQELINLGLLIRRENKLEVHNQIYRIRFSQDWIGQHMQQPNSELPEIPPQKPAQTPPEQLPSTTQNN